MQTVAAQFFPMLRLRAKCITKPLSRIKSPARPQPSRTFQRHFAVCGAE